MRIKGYKKAMDYLDNVPWVEDIINLRHEIKKQYNDIYRYYVTPAWKEIRKAKFQKRINNIKNEIHDILNK